MDHEDSLLKPNEGLEPRFFDTHAHLDDPVFAGDVQEVVARAAAAGVVRVVCIGTDLESSRRAVELSEQFDGLYAAVGWHPSHVLEAPEDVRPALRPLLNHPKVVAIGETGLDYYRLPSSQGGTGDEEYKRRQAELFRQHLELAAESGLNCVIHQRASLDDTITQMEPFAGRVGAVFHCFSADRATLERVLALGALVSFTGIVTFKNSQLVRETVAATPEGKWMLETDSPYLAPVPYRGKRCEPAYVKEIAACVAEVRGCDLDEVSRASCETARKFFRGLK